MVKKRRQPDVYHKQNLGDELENPENFGVRTKPRGQKRTKNGDNEAAGYNSADEDVEQSLPADISHRVLRVAREQAEEMAAVGSGEGAGVASNAASLAALRESDSDDEGGFSPGPGSAWGDEDDLDQEEISPEDEAALAAFMRPAGAKQKTLADVVAEKLGQAGGGTGLTSDPSTRVTPAGLDERLVEIFRGVGALMSRYTVGKLPKAFKVIPTLKNWEEVLALTEPEAWSPHAIYQATRIFVSNLNQRLSQRFLALVLLPAVRRDIRENKKLHFALFQALRKATYKAAAFYKGLLLPLCSYGSCTLREAVIFSSVLRRTSIPVLHSAAALLRIAEMEYSGTNSFFIRVLLDKKYALPYRVIDALVDHFTRFAHEERALPVVWHQALLCFVQRYKNEIRAEDKEALRRLLSRQSHHLVTPEVLRELDAGRSRGQKPAAGEGAGAQSRTASHVREDPAKLAPLILMED
ncbi:Bystin [Auxenochlorella protothecoides]|uniref:Bystin n=1 Tax=Auxenochlorella protothecoides TaxID=3075 RepID=A0A087SK50_AUXPR|nr:Bystin [Auxenochlorella protothecoides]KFM26104.1 Bystin [Auxenochlorella protothecoides]RMZ57327.1 hypothetical protein APUTEX25_004161 [Auxenochlorella protothecoides]|eukprot:RMZ57327.1 hypothetical protein APUTEX25_004161 [Auxenochlorella protothecoides]